MKTSIVLTLQVVLALTLVLAGCGSTGSITSSIRLYVEEDSTSAATSAAVDQDTSVCLLISLYRSDCSSHLDEEIMTACEGLDSCCLLQQTIRCQINPDTCNLGTDSSTFENYFDICPHTWDDLEYDNYLITVRQCTSAETGEIEVPLQYYSSDDEHTSPSGSSSLLIKLDKHNAMRNVVFKVRGRIKK